MRSDNINRVITPVNAKYGAPMGRANIDKRPRVVHKDGSSTVIGEFFGEKLYNKRVRLFDGYDKGGAYWGVGGELRVVFNKDLTYVKFYRVGDELK